MSWRSPRSVDEVDEHLADAWQRRLAASTDDEVMIIRRHIDRMLDQRLELAQ